jgi:hypothetical protein
LILGLSGVALGVTGAVVGTALWTAAVKNDVLVGVAQTAPPAVARDKLISDAGGLARDETAGAIVVWLAGGACLVGGIAYWAHSSLQTPPLATAVIPVLSPNHAGLALTGAW